MKITVSAVSFSSDISGIQRHALNLVRCLMRRMEVTRVDLVVAPWQAQITETLRDVRDSRLQIHVEHVGEGALSRNLWHYRELPVLAQRFDADVVHLSYPVPMRAGAITCPTVLSLHDLYPIEIPENFGFPKVMVNRWIMQQCLRIVNSIACVSDATLRKLERWNPGDAASKAVRIYNSAEPPTVSRRPRTHREFLSHRFLLAVAQHRKNKNIALLIRAFHRLMRDSTQAPVSRLVIVGIEGPETRHIRALITDLAMQDHVLLVHGLADDELQWCYTHCEALAAPSKTEGFGLPVAEALLAGARVVCSDIAAFREIGEGNCRFVSLGPAEETDLAAAIAATINGPPGKRVSLPQLSVETLSWEYVQLYSRLIRKREASTASARMVSTVVEENLALGQASPAAMANRRDEHGGI